MSEEASTIALVGSWSGAGVDRRATAAELARGWPSTGRPVSVFADLDAATQRELRAMSIRCWPEGTFGRHVVSGDFDHAVLMLGPRFESLLALARAADHGCHVWLQNDVVDCDESPIDAPVDWLVDMIGSARSVIVGSDWLAGVVRRLSPTGPPVLVMPPAHPIVAPIVETPGRVIAVAGGDDEVREYLSGALSADIVFVDDHMTSDVISARLLSARAGVEIRTHERGFASTTVTHMMARGLPTITTLGAHSPFASSLTTTGLVVIDDAGDSGDLLADIAELLRPILDDDRHWLEASTAAKTTAASWNWVDAAGVLSQWIHTADDLEPSTVRVVGAVAS